LNNQWFSKVAVWIVIALVLFTVFKQFDTRGVANAGYLGYSDFLEEVRGKRIKSAVIQEGQGGTEIVAITTDDRKVRTTATYLDRGLVGDLISNGVKFDVKPREESSLLMTLLVSWGPMLLLIGVWVYFMRQMQGGGKGGAFSFGKSKARMLDENTNQITFADVAGCDEAKEEVKEVVDFLKDPQRFQKLGGRIPRGLLLVGPPGTGKTLLAKGIAGEAKVPFFSISGSDFVEMFVGVGAARVRDMFDNAKKNAPCIIFIDEIDAVGRQRGAGLGGGNDEREQTLNQMLVEMDGFETNVGVIVVAATNRPDILDAALLRPGRFDRQVYVTLPDIRGREQILNVHMRKVPLGQDVSAVVIARGTPGMSGADLANLCNEAALMAARRGARGRDAGLREGQGQDPDGPRAQEHGHAGERAHQHRLPRVGPCADRQAAAQVRSGAQGHDHPARPRAGRHDEPAGQDRYSYDSEYMLNQISMLFGGRIAEEVFMKQMTTGASNDFERATHIARDMVTRYGMTDALGPMVYAENEGEVFLGRSVTKTTNMSEQTMQKVDSEVRRIIDQQYSLARKLIEDNQDKMHAMAKALLEWETIDSDQIDDIMAGKPPRPPKDWTPRTPAAGGAGGTPPVSPDPAPTAA
jgi:cell division protease FtsH